jgi:hypothetical protein
VFSSSIPISRWCFQAQFLLVAGVFKLNSY